MEQNENKEEKTVNEKVSDISDFEILSSEDSVQYDFTYKTIMIGDSGVGKTFLAYRATTGKKKKKISATIGFEYFPFVIKYKNKY